ncbi:4-amino-4-deoxy-L-arabinose transferase [Promicromonospora umidemergens]|nr:4-amino-4-deoxy-L-arabinose transferase [Promicromonospora umidemergens]
MRSLARSVSRSVSRYRPRLGGQAEQVAVLCAVVSGMLLALLVALADAPYATGDEPPHVDYAYQVWHGELPVFEDGLELRPDGAWLAPVQWTAQHPPLYYLLVAPLVGPLADAGHPVAAVYAARGVNVLLSGAFVLAAWWSARRLTRPGSVLPPLVAFLAGAMPATAHVGGNAYNDLLAATGVTVLFGLAATAVRRGLEPRLIMWLSLVAATCALTRLSAALIAAVVAAVALAAGAIRAGQGRGRWVHVVALALAGPGAVLATSGWFYLRNVQLTGTVTGSHFDWALANQNRQERPVWAVLADPETWLRLPDIFWWAGRLPPSTPLTVTTLVVTALLLVWTPMIVALITAVRRRESPVEAPLVEAPPAEHAETRRTDELLLRALPVIAVLVSVSVQVAYAASSGGVYPRYLLVVSVALCLAIAAGLAVRPRLLVPAWTAVTVLDLAVWLSVELATPSEPGYYAEASLPAAVVGVLAAATIVGSAVLALRAVRELSAARANRTDATTAAAPTTTVTDPTSTS